MSERMSEASSLARIAALDGGRGGRGGDGGGGDGAAGGGGGTAFAGSIKEPTPSSDSSSDPVDAADSWLEVFFVFLSS